MAQSLNIWRDEQLLVVNKPAGLPTLVDGWHPQAPYLVGLLKQTFEPLWVVHRLDKETSGVIVFALTAEAHRALNRQFEARQTEKIYHALVQGNPEWELKEARLALRPNGDRRHRTVVDVRQGKPALTYLKVLERYEERALVEAMPRTGRTHQIRAHLATLGYPIVGDTLYGGAQIPGFERMALHAFSLRLQHPLSGEELSFIASYPDDLSALLIRLQERAS